MDFIALPTKFTTAHVNAIERVDILPDNVAFLLYNVLSPTQCRWLEKQVEKSPYTKHVSKAGYRRDYRDCYRLIADAFSLAEYVLERIRPHLDSELDVHNRDGDLLQRMGLAANPLTYGQWQLHGLNPRFRMCKYLPGGHFAPHFDGDYAAHRDLRSFKTCMLYTNTITDGGTTDFLDTSSQTVYYSVKPVCGMAVVFNHQLYHCGTPLRSGVKYIVRSDVMYRRTGGGVSSEALSALEMAQDAEERGDYTQAVSCYKKAYRLCPELE